MSFSEKKLHVAIGLLGHFPLVSIKFGFCNLGFPYSFMESTGILQQWYALGFLGTYQPLPYWRFKRPVVCALAAVIGTAPVSQALISPVTSLTNSHLCPLLLTKIIIVASEDINEGQLLP